MQAPTRHLIVHADARRIPLPDCSVQCVVTSPPYWGLRDYGIGGQIGLEDTPEAYVGRMVEVFGEVKRILRNDGVLFLNLGDSYGPDKQLCGIPWCVAFALRTDGWYLRSEIIWAKPNPMPESVTDRPTKAHEQIFLLAKRPKYFYDAEAVKEPISAKTLTVSTTPRKGTGVESTGEKLNKWMAENGGRYHPESANLRTVWTITPKPFAGAHFATFPTELAARCIKAGTSEKGCCPSCGRPWERVVEREPMVLAKSGRADALGEFGRTCTSGTMTSPPKSKTLGWSQSCPCPPAEPVPCVVFDPFGGAGTVPLVAESLGRLGVCTELNPEYCRMATGRIRRPHRRVVRDETPLPLFDRSPA